MKNFILVLLLLSVPACNESETVKINSLEFRIAETEPADSLEEFTMKQTGEIFYLHKSSGISASHIAATKISERNESEAIEITFNDEGKELFAELTRNNIGNRIGMILNGELVSAPVVQAEIPNGKALVPLVKAE